MKLSLSNNTRVEQSAKNGLTWCQILGQIAFTFFGCLAAPSFGTKSGTRNRNKKLYPHCRNRRERQSWHPHIHRRGSRAHNVIDACCGMSSRNHQALVVGACACCRQLRGWDVECHASHVCLPAGKMAWTVSCMQCSLQLRVLHFVVLCCVPMHLQSLSWHSEACSAGARVCPFRMLNARMHAGCENMLASNPRGGCRDSGGKDGTQTVASSDTGPSSGE